MKKHAYLCQDVKLTIWRQPGPEGGEELQITLRDDSALTEAQLVYPLSENALGLVTRYHLREGLVIALRRVVDEAIKEGVIKIARKP
jgi:hypothetical protein